MTDKFECGDHAGLVTYLYDEAAPGERAAIEAHLAICPACAAEVAALSSTRTQMAAWTPPEADLSFRIISEPPRAATVLRPARWWQQPLPAWAQVAAAAAIFAVGVGLGVTMNGETASTPAPAVAQAPASTPGLTPAQATTAGNVSRDDLAALERRLRSELRAATVVAPATVPAAARSEAELLARVRALIDESEQRQRRELALRTAEVVRDLDAQRQFDLVRMQRAFGQFEGTAGAEIQRQRQDLNNLIRVTSRPQ